MPERVQLSRKSGFRLPPNTVSVARPTKWGNPHRVGAALHECRTAQEAVDKFRRGFAMIDELGFIDSPIGRMSRDLHVLRGKNLACWCKLGAPCHADVLLELANREPEA